MNQNFRINSEPDQFAHRKLTLPGQSLYLTGEYQAAFDVVEPKSREFPKDWKLAYDLVCYCCRLGRLDEASAHFHRAMENGNRQEVQRRMLDDPDMEPL